MRVLSRSLTLSGAVFVLGLSVLAAKEKEDAWPFPAGPLPKTPVMDPFGQMTIDQVERRLGLPNIYIYDGNGDDTYHHAHIPGAIRLGKAIDAENLPADKDATLIFYCTNML